MHITMTKYGTQKQHSPEDIPKDTSGNDIPEDKSEPMYTLGEETDCSSNLERNSHTHQNPISMELTFLKEKSETQIHTSGKTDCSTNLKSISHFRMQKPSQWLEKR